MTPPGHGKPSWPCRNPQTVSVLSKAGGRGAVISPARSLTDYREPEVVSCNQLNLSQ